MTTIRVFQSIEEIDAFVVTPEFSQLADYLGLTEWVIYEICGRYA
jgi:hypothetical protein